MSTFIHQKWAISESIHVNFVDFQQNSYFKLLILDHGTYFNISPFETKKYTNIEDLSHLHKKSCTYPNTKSHVFISYFM